MRSILRNLVFVRKELGNISFGALPFVVAIHYPYNELQYNNGKEKRNG